MIDLSSPLPAFTLQKINQIIMETNESSVMTGPNGNFLSDPLADALLFSPSPRLIPSICARCESFPRPAFSKRLQNSQSVITVPGMAVEVAPFLYFSFLSPLPRASRTLLAGSLPSFNAFVRNA